MRFLSKAKKWLTQPTAGGNGVVRIEVESDANPDAEPQGAIDVDVEEPEVEAAKSSEEETDASTNEETPKSQKPQKAEEAPKPKKAKSESGSNGAKNATKPKSNKGTKQTDPKAKNGGKKAKAKNESSDQPETAQSSSMPEPIEKSDLEARPMPWLPKDEEPAGEVKLKRVFMCEDGRTCYDMPNFLMLCAQPTEIPEVWQWAAEVDSQERIVSAETPLQTPNWKKKEIRRVIQEAQAEDAQNGISLPGRAKLLDIRTGNSVLSVSMMPNLQRQLEKGEKERSLENDVRSAYGQLETFQGKYAELLRKKDEFLREREKARKGKGLMDYEMFKLTILSLRAELHDLWKEAEMLYESVGVYEDGKENSSDLEKSSLTKDEQTRFLEMLEVVKTFAVIDEEEKLDEDFFPEGIFASAPHTETEGAKDPKTQEEVEPEEDSESGDEPKPENEEVGGAAEEEFEEESDDGLEAVSAEQFDEKGFEAFGKDSSDTEETSESVAEEPETENEALKGPESGSSYKLTQEELEALLGTNDIPGLDMSPEEREALFEIRKTDDGEIEPEPEDLDEASEAGAETNDGVPEAIQEDVPPASKTSSVLGAILGGPAPKAEPDPQSAPQPAPAGAAQMPDFDMQEFSKNLTAGLTDAITAAMTSVTQQNMAAARQSMLGFEEYAKVNTEQTQRILDLYKGQAQQLGEILTANEEMFDRKLNEHAEKQAAAQKGQIEEALQDATITLEGGLSEEARKEIDNIVQRNAISNAEMERISRNLGNQMKGLAKDQASKGDIQALMLLIQEVHETMIGLGRYMDGVLPQGEQVSPYDAAVGTLAEKIGAERVQRLIELSSEQLQELIDFGLENAEELED